MSPRTAVPTDMPAEMDAVGGAEVAVSPLEGIPWPGGINVAEPFASTNTGVDGDWRNTGEGQAETDIACHKGHADTLVPVVAAADPPEDGIQPVTDGPSSFLPAPGSPTAVKARRVAKARPAHVTSLPLLGPTVNSRSLVLAATTDASLDLTGDVGPIGRFGALPPPGGRGIQVDLKGTMYNTLRSPTNTALVVDMGADAARVVAAFHEVLWMIPQDEDAAANHLSGEEEEDDLADHQMLYSAGRTGGAGKASGGSGSLGTGNVLHGACGRCCCCGRRPAAAAAPKKGGSDAPTAAAAAAAALEENAAVATAGQAAAAAAAHREAERDAAAAAREAKAAAAATERKAKAQAAAAKRAAKVQAAAERRQAAAARRPATAAAAASTTAAAATQVDRPDAAAADVDAVGHSAPVAAAAVAGDGGSSPGCGAATPPPPPPPPLPLPPTSPAYVPPLPTSPGLWFSTSDVTAASAGAPAAPRAPPTPVAVRPSRCPPDSVALADTGTTVYALGPAAAYARLHAAVGGDEYGDGYGDGRGVRGRTQTIADPGPPPPLPPALYGSTVAGDWAGSVSDGVNVDALFGPPSGG